VEKVFWLPDHPVSRAFSGSCRMTFAAFVPGYSGGTTTDLHRLPDSNVMKMLIHGWHWCQLVFRTANGGRSNGLSKL